MSDEQGKSILFGTCVLALALIVWSEIHDNHRLPIPSRFLGIGLVWGTLGLVGPFVSYPLAAAIGAGMLLALYYQHFTGKGTMISQGLAPAGSGGVSPVPNGGPPGVAPLQTMPLN